MGKASVKSKNKTNESLTLVGFIELVKDETLLINEPLFSKSATD